ncbi:MAG: hypothetical protein WCL21_19505 [Mariniphaga sp.]
MKAASKGEGNNWSADLNVPDGYTLVPADAIVLTGITRKDLLIALYLGDTAPNWKEILELLKSSQPSLAEPTDFGAMVEAGAEDVTGRYVFKKVRYGGAPQWVVFVGVSVHFADWSDLIIPTLFCEGQVK